MMGGAVVVEIQSHSGATLPKGMALETLPENTVLVY
jgi:hypothetical protein